MKPFAEMSPEEQRAEYTKYCMRKAFHDATKPDKVDPQVPIVNPKKKCSLCQVYDQEKKYCRLSSTLCINSSNRPSFRAIPDNELPVSIQKGIQIGIL